MSSTQMNENNIWEQLPSESDDEFELFKIYRALQPSERNTLKTWEVYAERNNLPKKYDKRLDRISERCDWHQRALEFDSYYEQTLVDYVSKDQYRELLDFRKKQRDLSGRLTEISLGMLRLVQTRLLSVKPEELTVAMLPKYIETVAKIVGMSFDSEASALMLTELAQAMQGGIDLNVNEPAFTSDDSIWQEQ